ncbi:MAG: Lrp/AsnC family transcriptional regulator [Cohaesibacter sp.]|jgi:DNA-binding Lrp family transcriptional regulator|nr:Lrp/AsnC family transcriptional regulator [Cohaesibacter sp.]
MSMLATGAYADLDEVDMAIVDDWQRDFPLVPRPFSKIAQENECREAEILDRYKQLKEKRILSRIGTILAPNTIGASVLAAMAVPIDQVDQVAASISNMEGVNHNYERENTLNLWFVVTAGDRQAVDAILARLEAETGFEVFPFFLEQAYHLDLGFSLRPNRGHTKVVRAEIPDTSCIQPEDRALLGAIEDGLPLVGRPYMEIANGLGWTEARVLGRLQDLLGGNIIRRLGCVVHHRKVGYKANAMVVWDIADDKVNDIAPRLARDPGVTLCYRRNRHPGRWPYNLYCMVHAASRPDAQAVIERLNNQVGLNARNHSVLFSRRCFKQRGAQLGSPARHPSPHGVAAQ